MIDPVQLVVSVLGVTLIVVLVWLAAGGSTEQIGDQAAVLGHLRRELPGFAVGELAVDARGRTALARSLDGSEVALLFVTGRRVTAWRMPAASLRVALRPSSAGGTMLDVATSDFGRPHVKLDLADPAHAEKVLASLTRGADA